jgi:hypothetical protein
MNNRILKRFIIDKSFQFKFVMYCLFFNILLSGLFLFSAYRFFRQFEEMGRSAGFPSDHSFFQFIGSQELHLYTNMLWSFLCVFIFALIFGIIQSHKIAGPLYRLKIELMKMSKNNGLSPISFRKKDYFQYIPEEFNKMIDSVGKPTENKHNDSPMQKKF